MDKILIRDIINEILNHLDEDSSFNLINSSLKLRFFNKLLYNKYLFNNSLIIKDNIKQYIHHVKNIYDLKCFSYLKSLIIDNNNCLKLLINLPATLEELDILNNKFNEQLNNLPVNFEIFTNRNRFA